MTCRSWVGQALLLSVLTHLVVVSGQNDNADEEALLSLPQSLANWAAVTQARSFVGWNLGSLPVCNWTGVTCNKASRVSALNLACNGCSLGFTGTLPPELSGLDLLETMDFSNNTLSGSLPESLGAAGVLSMLTSMSLAYNNFSGQLPASWLANTSFVALLHLDVSHNLLSGSLPAALLLGQLQVLDVQHNLLSGPLPSSWSQEAVLARALELRLSSNRLTGTLPDAWAGASAFPLLQVFSAAYNGLNGTLPSGWGAAAAFPQLQKLDVSSNQLQGSLVKQWGTQGGWLGLAALNLTNNSLTGTLPVDWATDAAMPVLQTLLLSNNQLAGNLQPAWGSSVAWSSLVCLSLSSNQLNGSLPPSWGTAGAFPLLQQLYLDYNGLHGTLPSNWGANSSFPQLATLNLAGNTLFGPLPAWGNPASSSLPVLTTLRLEWNLLSGTIPASFSMLPDLVSMAVSPGNYQLCGGLPERAHFSLCRQLGSFCQLHSQLGSTCQQASAVARLALPLSSANSNRLLAVLGFQGMVGDNTTAEDMLLVRALTELLPATAGQVQVVRSFDADTMSGGRRLLAGKRTLAQASNSSSHDVEVSLQSGPTANTTTLEGQLVDSVSNNQLLNTLTALGGRPTSVQLLASVPLNSLSLQPPSPLTVNPAPPTPPPSPASSASTSQTAGRRGLDTGAIVATVMVPVGVVGLVVAAGVFALRRRWDQGHLTGKGLGNGSHLKKSSGLPQHHSSPHPPSARSSPLPLVDQLRSQLHSETTQHGVLVSSSGSDLGNYEHTERHTGDAMALWDDALRRAGVAGASPDTTGLGSSTSQQLLARGSGPGRPGDVSGSSSLPLALSRARRKPPQRSAGSRSAGSTPTGMKLRPTDEQFLLPNMPWHDWEIAEDDVVIDKRPDGSDWELGTGAFGKVYRAVLSGMTSVAVKVLHEHDEDMNFGREIAILRSCRHSNIVQFLGVCVTGTGRVMLVTEYMSGGDLWHALGRPVVSRAVFGWHVWGHKVAIDLARGLHFLHSRVPSIVHFDLKSHNILLARDGTAKIADVGVARILTQAYVSQLGEIAGTFAWASPELLLGQRCSEKADIYAFGVVVWELATGERPQRGQLRDVLVPDELPEAVHGLMLECMDSVPEKRPSARAIFDRLTAIHPLEAPS